MNLMCTSMQQCVTKTMQWFGWYQYDKQQQYYCVQSYIRINNTTSVPKDIILLCSLFFYFDEFEQHLNTLKGCNIIPENAVRRLCDVLKNILIEESNITRISHYEDNKLIVVGGVHAQFFDLKYCIFEHFGYPKNDVTSPMYVFLGNYSNKGYYNTETTLLLLTLKLKYPSKIIILRGRHETRQFSQVYGCYEDMMRKYGSADVWRWVNNIFDYLPLCALINDKIFLVSGGLSPQINTLDQIELIDRNIEPSDSGPITDLLWSVPDTSVTNTEWRINGRGVGYAFGNNVVNTFCKQNNIDMIIRSSGAIMNAYEYMFDKKLLSVASAPNKSYRMGNKGCVAVIDKMLNVEICMYDAAPDEKRKPSNNSNG
eukprot:352744_1